MSCRGTKDGCRVPSVGRPRGGSGTCPRRSRSRPAVGSGALGSPWGRSLRFGRRDVSERALCTVDAKALGKVSAARGAAGGFLLVRGRWYVSGCKSRFTTLAIQGGLSFGWSAVAISSFATLSGNVAVKAAVSAGLRPWASLRARSCGSWRQRGWAGTGWKREATGLWKSSGVVGTPSPLAVVLRHRWVSPVLEDEVIPGRVPRPSNTTGCGMRDTSGTPQGSRPRPRGLLRDVRRHESGTLPDGHLVGCHLSCRC